MKKNLDQFSTYKLDQFLTYKRPNLGPAFNSTAHIYIYICIYTGKMHRCLWSECMNIQIIGNTFNFFLLHCLFQCWGSSCFYQCYVWFWGLLSLMFLPLCWHPQTEPYTSMSKKGGFANGGLRDGGLSESEDIWGKRPFSSVFWISQVLFAPSGKGRKRQKKGEKGRFRPISRKGGQTPLKPPFVTPPFAAAQQKRGFTKFSVFLKTSEFAKPPGFIRILWLFFR